MARVLISKTSITGEVKAFAGSAAPEGYLFCNGQPISRTVYEELWNVLGTSHGQGDGSTTFNLPDYRGTFLRGKVDITTVTGSGAVSSNNVTFTNHGINRTGFKVRLQSAGGLTGLALSTDYYAIVIDNNTLAFATTLTNAIAGTKISISGAGPLTIVITQYEDPDASSRTASTVGGNSGNSMGARQGDAIGPHVHPMRSISSANYSGGGSSNTPRANSTTDNNWDTYNNVGAGNENRPQNSLINYIIKY